MTDRVEAGKSDAPQDVVAARREMLKKLGRFVLVSAPAVTLLLAAGSKPARAVICSVCPPSSRSFKTFEGGIDASALLAAVAALPVGPSPENFQDAFGLGDGLTIGPVDAVGVCLAAIQALSRKVEGLEVLLTGAEFQQAA